MCIKDILEATRKDADRLLLTRNLKSKLLPSFFPSEERSKEVPAEIGRNIMKKNIFEQQLRKSTNLPEVLKLKRTRTQNCTLLTIMTLEDL